MTSVNFACVWWTEHIFFQFFEIHTRTHEHIEHNICRTYSIFFLPILIKPSAIYRRRRCSLLVFFSSLPNIVLKRGEKSIRRRVKITPYSPSFSSVYSRTLIFALIKQLADFRVKRLNKKFNSLHIIYFFSSVEMQTWVSELETWAWKILMI